MRRERGEGMGGEPLAEARSEDEEVVLQGTWRGPDSSVLDLERLVDGPADDVVLSDMLAGGKLSERER